MTLAALKRNQLMSHAHAELVDMGLTLLEPVYLGPEQVGSNSRDSDLGRLQYKISWYDMMAFTPFLDLSFSETSISSSGETSVAARIAESCLWHVLAARYPKTPGIFRNISLYS